MKNATGLLMESIFLHMYIPGGWHPLFPKRQHQRLCFWIQHGYDCQYAPITFAGLVLVGCLNCPFGKVHQGLYQGLRNRMFM